MSSNNTCENFSKPYDKLNFKFRKGWQVCTKKTCDPEKSHYCNICFDRSGLVQRHPPCACPTKLLDSEKEHDIIAVGNSNAKRFNKWMKKHYNVALPNTYACNGAELFKTKGDKPAIRDLLDHAIENSEASIILLFQPAQLTIVNNLNMCDETFGFKYRDWYRAMIEKASSKKKVIFLVTFWMQQTIKPSKDKFITELCKTNNKNSKRINDLLKFASSKSIWYFKDSNYEYNNSYSCIKIEDQKISKDGEMFPIYLYDRSNGLHLSDDGYHKVFNIVCDFFYIS